MFLSVEWHGRVQYQPLGVYVAGGVEAGESTQVQCHPELHSKQLANRNLRGRYGGRKKERKEKNSEACGLVLFLTGPRKTAIISQSSQNVD